MKLLFSRIFFVLLGLSTFLSAQKINTTATIVKLKGQAKLEVLADEMQLLLELNAQGEEAQAVIDLLTQKMQQIQAVLGAEKDTSKLKKIQNQQFTLDKNRVYTPSGMQEKGFNGVAQLLLTLSNQAEYIAALIAKILESGTAPTFALTYGLADEAKLKDQLLQSALNDARAKAEIIAENLKIKVKRAVLVQYEVPVLAPVFRSLAYESSAKMQDAAAAMNTRMAPLTLSDKLLSYLQMSNAPLVREVEVWVDWELEK